MSSKDLTGRQAGEWMNTLIHKHDDLHLSFPHFMHTSTQTSARLARESTCYQGLMLSQILLIIITMLFCILLYKKMASTNARIFNRFATTQHFRTLHVPQLISS